MTSANSTEKHSQDSRHETSTSSQVVTGHDHDVVVKTKSTPYHDARFIGTYFSATLGVVGSFQSYIMPVTALPIILVELGPSPNATWIALAWTLLSALSFTLLGRLSDVFGRRWFMVGSTLIATIGCIIGATASHTDTLIAASALLGLASAGELSINYSLGELVPIRHRFLINGFIYLATLPTAALGPYLARLIIINTSSNWRGIYYLGIALHGSSTLGWLTFYHPPVFNQLHRNRTRLDELRDLDYGGIFLFLVGVVLFLLGLSWGGQLYPWSDAKVLSTLVIGFVVLVVFIFYETWMPLQRPLVPVHLFNYGYTTFNILSAVGGIVYYSMSLLFPTMVARLFETDIVKGGLLSCAVGGGVCAGQVVGSLIAVPGGHLRLKLMFTSAGMTAFLAGLAGATENEKTAVALAVLAGFMVGFVELSVSTAVTVVIADQSEIGTAAGLFGSIRAAAGVLATAIYTTILNNRVNDGINALVIPRLVQAGLTESSTEALVQALSSGASAQATSIPGVSESTVQIAETAYRETYAQAFTTVYLATIAFGALSFIAACFIPSLDDKLTKDVVRRMGKDSDT